jgi:predicted nucleic acid-binding protein
MRTAVDTSVLVAIFNAEPTGEDWLKTVITARREGQLVICEVVYGEVARGFESSAELDKILERLGIWFESITKEAAFRAGKAFSQYRKRGGPRTKLIPDFLVASHALEQANRLATEDRGYYREYFSGLKLVGREA